MKHYSNIVLVGFMGTGKTSVGKALAKRLRMVFVDMDNVIEQRVGMTVTQIFEEKGEREFRALERQLVHELSAKSGLVVATGGGIVLNPDNISDFSRNGLVVCLSARPETILARLSADSSRPLLTDCDKKNRIVTLLDSRKKLYNAVPHQVDTTDSTIAEIADKVVALFNTASNMDGKK
jgi:shikimate kinase